MSAAETARHTQSPQDKAQPRQRALSCHHFVVRAAETAPSTTKCSHTDLSRWLMFSYLKICVYTHRCIYIYIYIFFFFYGAFFVCVFFRPSSLLYLLYLPRSTSTSFFWMPRPPQDHPKTKTRPPIEKVSIFDQNADLALTLAMGTFTENPCARMTIL